MTHEEKLQRIKDLREEQIKLILKVKKIRRYPPPKTTKIAIRRAMTVIDCMIKYRILSTQIAAIAQTPVPNKYKKGGIFNEGIATICEKGEELFLLESRKPIIHHKK